MIATFGYKHRLKRARPVLDYGMISTTCENPSYQEPNVSGAGPQTESRNEGFTQSGGYHGESQSPRNKLPTEGKQSRGEHPKKEWQATVEDDYDELL